MHAGVLQEANELGKGVALVSRRTSPDGTITTDSCASGREGAAPLPSVNHQCQGLGSTPKHKGEAKESSKHAPQLGGQGMGARKGTRLRELEKRRVREGADEDTECFPVISVAERWRDTEGRSGKA